MDWHDFWTVSAPGWITGAGTLGLAAVTFQQGRREKKARIQAEAVGRQRQDDADRHQASRISSWVHFGEEASDGASSTVISLCNMSDAPVYNFVAVIVFVMGVGPHTGRESIDLVTAGVQPWAVVTTMPPGVWDIDMGSGWIGMSRRAEAEIAFTDTSGRHWLREGTGGLREIEASGPKYYRLNGPFPPPVLRPTHGMR